MANYKYKFSIVTAVYNVEDFVAETIDSLIAQDIGFKNIQLILVDDGSPDNSGKICDEYAKKYPDNIIVIHKENGGVSSARNTGLDHVEGKYVNFIDSDDKFTPSTLSSVWKFFESNYDKTDVVGVPLRYFDGKTGNHVLNFKFGKTKIVDLNENFDFVHLSAASSFIKADAIKDKRFNCELAYGEDGLFIQEVLLDKQTLGVVSEAEYMYRSRATSAINNSLKNPKWYTATVENFHLALINKCKDELGYIPRFTQYAIMYDMQWRVKVPEVDTEVITPEEKDIYLDMLAQIMSNIDDDIVMAQKNISREYKFSALNIKYKRLPEIVKTKDNIHLVYEENPIFFASNFTARVEFVKVENDTLIIDGHYLIFDLPFKNLKVKAITENGEYVAESIHRDSFVSSLGKNIQRAEGFVLRIPLKDCKDVFSIKLALEIDGVTALTQRYSYRYFSPITNSFVGSYYNSNGWILSVLKKRIVVQKKTFARLWRKRIKLMAALLTRKNFRSKEAAFSRFILPIVKFFMKKPVWLISDRGEKAGDNGEAFFRYMVKEHPEIDARFVIRKDCADFERLRKIGPVVAKGTYKNRLLILLSECILTSQLGNDSYDQFGIYRSYYKDLLAEKKVVFLQHGVIKYNFASWLNRYNKNIFGFVTSAHGEWKSIVDEGYHYTEKEVWLTGLPRWDRLYEDSQRRITIMPTWRKYLTKGRNTKTGGWHLIPDFEESRYFTYYNSLLNDEKLISAAKKYGYKISFLPHPNIQPHISLFTKHPDVDFFAEDVSYTDIYAHSDLVVTDYSSAVFDFAYMRKPLVYNFFDADEFYAGGHTSSGGYFDDVKDSFGEVEYDLEATVNRIIEYMENGCQLKDMYRERIDRFFAYSDKNNCQRVYDKVMENK